jgi:peptidoglycan/LPS O-acetylase OafA/YrhL
MADARLALGRSGAVQHLRVTGAAVQRESNRLAVLDGWRAVSIVAVLAGHLLPLSIIIPKANEAAGLFGMAVFFTLSGFLITRFLIERPDPRAFIIRRGFRILPLAWVGVIAAFLIDGRLASPANLVPNLLFYANWPPVRLFESGAHLWSLGVEVQFYAAIALAVAFFGRKALYALPFVGLAVTVARVATGAHFSIVTWFRIDEILAGALVALIWSGWFGDRAKAILNSTNTWFAAIFALAICYFADTSLAYVRPYAVALMVGSTLAGAPALLEKLLTSRAAAYVATISYALYVFHALLAATWLGSGEDLERYLKRPLLIGATFLLAHLSTTYFEKHFIDWGKRLTRHRAPA